MGRGSEVSLSAHCTGEMGECKMGFLCLGSFGSIGLDFCQGPTGLNWGKWGTAVFTDD